VSITRQLVDESGAVIVLGARLGSGGEGSVFDTPEIDGDVVAKIYHETVPVHKQAKLHAMTSLGNSYLRTISAWPLRTVRELPSGQIAGFLMPKITGCEPIHHLYSPSQRKQFFPKADYAFLISAARNIAAAFDSIHAHGHVVGDVNQGNLVARADSIVRFIDCDSFQITVGHTRFPCEVGVQHFTPPELQNIKSFHTVARTPNHDTFGLAVLVFHLLFMGRHPYAGIYLGEGDMPIEKAIAELRFAYGPGSTAREMETPPNALPLSLVTPEIAQLFERAFTEVGTQTGRPSAAQWVAALDVFRRQQRTCGADHAHKFPAHLSTCPWCEIEGRSGMQFFLPMLSPGVLPADASATAEQIWQRIRQITPPPRLPEYREPKLSVTPAAVPRELRLKALMYRGGLLIGLLGLGVALALWSDLAPLWILTAAALIGFGLPHDPYTEIRAERAQALRLALKNFAAITTRYQQLADVHAFADKMQQLTRAKTAYDGLPRLEQLERMKLRGSVRDAQLRKYLAGFLIAHAKIGLIGPGRKATLASFGIETAADVGAAALARVRGFGDTQKADLLAWRAGLESKFLFNPGRGVDPHDAAALSAQFAAQKSRLDTVLREGLSELQKLRADLLRMRHATQALLESAARDKSQAQADYVGIAGRWALRRLIRRSES
jgi:DNA-binding helix-hairpin-helix protein with protein kinase domain